MCYSIFIIFDVRPYLAKNGPLLVELSLSQLSVLNVGNLELEKSLTVGSLENNFVDAFFLLEMPELKRHWICFKQ